MRLAIINSNRSIVGGVETYLSHVLPALAERGHEIAFLHEEASVAGYELITLPEGAPVWSIAQSGSVQALDALRQWGPDIVYVHGLRSPKIEAEIQAIAPAVFFAHSYYAFQHSGIRSLEFT